MEVVIQIREAIENSLDVLNDPQSSWKYVENMYYMNIQLSPLSLNPFFLDDNNDILLYPCVHFQQPNGGCTI